MSQGVHRYARRPKLNLEEEKRRQEDRRRFAEENYDDIWRTAQLAVESASTDKKAAQKELAAIRQKLGLPEENLLYFLEKRAPRLKPWQRELVRIARHISQYFYPQKQTKVMNEGCATFVHHTIMNLLYERGLINEGSLLEFLHSHTSVVFQPEFDDRRFNGINPYALGYGMMADIKRICEQPTNEDRDWFPQFAGTGDAMAVLRDALANYRDESFIEQFLSPKLMRDFRMFALHDEAEASAYKVSAIHNEDGYRRIRAALARQYDVGAADPNIQVTAANLMGDRKLLLEHRMHRGIPLHEQTKELVCEHLERLWGHEVELEEVAGDV
jgi:spore cortex formation protein SpoVR/YcgB (stage V sporulation)